MKKLIVIGAGASGIIASIKSSELYDVTLLEKNSKPLKKLLITGNGKCNYWHDNITSNSYVTDNNELLNKILSYQDKTYNFLERLGLYPLIKDGYYYPYSESSNSVYEIFIREIKKRNINLICDYNVTKIEKVNNKFIINNELECDKLIIACGSKAYPKTGSDGYSYEVANNFNIKVNKVLPSLVSLKSNEKYFKDLNGIRCHSIINLFIDDKLIKKEEGNLQFTDYGLSGICIFNLSNYISKSLNENKKVEVKINLLPFLDTSMDEFIKSRNLYNNSLINILESLLNYKLINLILKKCNLKSNILWSNLTKEEKDLLNTYLLSFPVIIDDISSFDKAQTCIGGISLNEMRDNLESKKIDNLYFIGESLDVTGICGGYNLAFAFITGYIVGSDLND